MPRIMGNIRVLEVAMWTFVPSAGAVLAEWGADVIKVEHPVTGDPQRGLISAGLFPEDAGGINYMIEIPNRGKRGIGIDLASEAGREILYRLAETSDVFLTSFLPDARRRLGIELEDIRARNPRIIYARGSAHGVRGPEAQRGGFDSASYWARGGVGYVLTPPEMEHPVRMRSAFGDIMGGLTIAGGIAAALYRRERTGESSVIDVSLLGLAAWNLSVDIASSKLFPDADAHRHDPNAPANPIVHIYRTRDGRFLNLTMLQSDRYWPDLCEHLGRTDLVSDPRFLDHEARGRNTQECTKVLQDIFSSRTLAEWKEALATVEGVWSALQTPLEVHGDAQVVANGYIREVPVAAGGHIALASNPVQFDETPPSTHGAPEHGQHTEEILLDLGMSWDEIAAHKRTGAIN